MTIGAFALLPFLVGPSSCGLESGAGGPGAACTRDRDCQGDLECHRGVCALADAGALDGDVDGSLDAGVDGGDATDGG